MFETTRRATAFLALACLLACAPLHGARAQGAAPDGQAAIDAYREARDAVADAIASGDREAADEAREQFDRAQQEFDEGVESGEIGEYLEEVLERVLWDLQADLNKLELSLFEIVGPLGEGFFSDEPIEDDPEDTFTPDPPQGAVSVGTEYDAAEVFRPTGNRRPYGVLPPGAWMPAPEPGPQVGVGIGDMFEALSTLPPVEPGKTHVVEDPAPSHPATGTGHPATSNPCSYAE